MHDSEHVDAHDEGSPEDEDKSGVSNRSDKARIGSDEDERGATEDDEPKDGEVQADRRRRLLSCRIR